MTSQLHKGGQRLRSARAIVLERDGPWCGRCTGWIDVTLSGLQFDGLTLGHVIPASRGGTDEIANLRPEHRRCNLAAAARLTPPRAVLAVPIP